MKNLNNFFLSVLFVMIFLIISINPQSFEPLSNQNQKIDITSKAQGLGIAEDQLQQILNSSVNNIDGDPLPEAMQERFFTGQASNDGFGVSVASSGDINGDGFEDIIVGASDNDAGGVNAGRAYIYFGGLIINNLPDVILTGAAAVDLFGRTVSSAGDVNGDGYSDVIVGAAGNDAGGTNAGRAYIYFGGQSMDNTADVLLTGEVANDQFGFSVSEAGDINGDGYSDVIAASFFNDAGGTDAGRAYIYFGGQSMNNIVDVVLTGEATGDFFGYSISEAGDVNGDGYSDVIVGARNNDAGGTDAGRTYIYFGGQTMDNISDILLTGENAGDTFGFAVSTAGDVNGDGYADVIIGAANTDFGGINSGGAYIFLGGQSMNNIADVVLAGVAASDQFGLAVSTAGDINGDGYSDVIAGAYFNDAGGNNAGRAYVYFGDEYMDNITDAILTGEIAGDQFGFSVSNAGDVNGDGYSDVIVGANLNDAGGTSAGRAYLYTNSLTGIDIPDEFFTGEATGDQFGYSVSDAGDVNGDGYNDLIVGARTNDAGGSDAGRTYIYFGGTVLNNTADVVLTGEIVGDNFGISVSKAGDINGDGFADVIVGAIFNDAGGANNGGAYIYFGGASMNSTADVILSGEGPNDSFGYSVSEAGDVNSDGYADVIVGAPFNDFAGMEAGRSYIYFGGASMDNTSDVILTGEAASNSFGYSVSAAGDVNGDGYSDVIVGAHGFNPGGRAYIYFGSTGMNNITDVILTGEATGDFFGGSVSGAGDVNKDGFSDVIAGANLNDAGGNNSGRAYIYFGGITMDFVADVILTGVMSTRLGYSVSEAGDLNNDGYSDVIVGSDIVGTLSSERVYINFGGSSMDNISDIVLTSESPLDDAFGESVSSAGDINGDGYSDVIVGAPENVSGGINDAGRAYLYLSSSPSIKPRVLSVKDIPFDQGGNVFVNFMRSGYDAHGESNIITEYLIEMSSPPGINGFSWIQIGSVQPVQNPLYTFLAQTPNDSTTNNSGTYYFRVTARTSEPNQYWRSNIMYGHSVDNLSPSPPLNFYANLINEDVKLGWNINTESDLKDYVIYRTDYPNADPDTLTPLAQLLDTTYIDTNPLSGTSYYYLRAQDVHNNFSPTVSVIVSEQTTFALSVTVANGWNMVSTPGLNSPDQNVNTWWQFRDPGANVFKYLGGYQSVTTTTPGTGYWMKHSGARTYNSGDEWPVIQIVNHSPLNGAAGWNLIGGYEAVVPTSAITTNPPGLISGPVYGYSGGYYTSANLEPGYGYWMKLTGNGQINLPNSLVKADEEKSEWLSDDWGKIIFNDAEGRSFTLYSVKDNVNLNNYELPPAPPAGSFDIRFNSGRIAENINSSQQKIDLSGVTYPLTVRAEGMDIRLTDETGTMINVNLKSGEDVVISDDNIQKLMVSGNQVPNEFSLEQNYPNPFNPSTKIKYSIPSVIASETKQSQFLSLKIYDVLGNEVATLVNEEKPAGNYEVEFNASNLASGIYFYRLQAGNPSTSSGQSFVETKKMILIK